MNTLMRLVGVVVLIGIAPSLHGQQNQNVYIQSTSRSVPSGGNAAFETFVREVIKPLYAEAVDSGHLQGWYMWRTRYRSEDESYGYIFAAASQNLANLEDELEGGAVVAAQRVLDMTRQEFNAEVQQGASTIEKRELWSQSSLSILQGADPAKFASVRYYRGLPGQRETINRELAEFTSPWQQGRLDKGISAGWGYFTRAYPFDSEDSYDSAEISYYDEFSQIMGAGIGQQIWEDVREDNSESGTHRRALNESRTVVKVELWELMDYEIAD